MIRVPEGLGSHSGPVGCDEEAGGWLTSGSQQPLSLERPDSLLALPFPFQAARTQGGAEEHAVKGIINDLLIGKQSSQGSDHDLPAIMSSTACQRPLLLCGD